MNEQTTSTGQVVDQASVSASVDALDNDALIRQMRWRCRRGILEVEMILQPYFERHAQTLVTERKEIMDQLLSCADTDLMAWFTGGQLPEAPDLSAFVQEILVEHRAVGEQAGMMQDQGAD